MKLIRIGASLLSIFSIIIAFQNCGQTGTVISQPDVFSANSDGVGGGNVAGDRNDGAMVIVPSPNTSHSETTIPGHPETTIPGHPETANPGHPETANLDHPETINLDHPETINLDQPDADVGDAESGLCHNIKVADFMLEPKSVKLSGNQNKLAFEIVDSDPKLSLKKMSLKIKALQNAKVRQLFLELAADRNYLLSESEELFNLKTPSAQTSGLKVHLNADISVESGKVYLLNLVIDPNEQIVMNASKCLFKPVIKQASLSLN